MAEFTFSPLTPASFADRAAAVFADRTAIIDGERSFTYRNLSDRCRRLAGALAAYLRRELAEGSLPGPNSAGRPPYRPEGVAR